MLLVSACNASHRTGFDSHWGQILSAVGGGGVSDYLTMLNL